MQSSTKDIFSYAQMEALHADQRIGQVWQNMLDSLDSVKGFIQPNHSPHLAVLVQFFIENAFEIYQTEEILKGKGAWKT